nr:NADH-quinone oxidoreductase subunit L [Thiohalorhabdus denitrificans]
MAALLPWIPALPLAGFVVLALLGGQLGRGGIATVGVGSVAASFALALVVGAEFLGAPPPGDAVTATAWLWMAVGDLQPAIAFYLDPLALVMTLVVTGVGMLIHLYSAEYMAEDPGYRRYFAYLNLFVAAMLTLVLADNLLLLYLGWEGVGVCSYLLIGFWYTEPENGRAARKAFVITRVGDVALLVGLLLLLDRLGTLQIQPLLAAAEANWAAGSAVAVAAAALLLGGAVGKSAQLPLQSWLPDAMAGPTPVSALIHAATMVTAGVYLIARTHPLFVLAPPVMEAVAAVGAATLLLAALSALVQRDLKRILAYSTISQIGYMFLALGVGAWSAAIFHFMTHAFFKALLFLTAGAVIAAMHHEHDIFRMGGLWRRMPVTFAGFLAGAAALAAFPAVTAGFFSKDLILAETWAASPALWLAGWLGAWLTAFYIFRAVFVVFFGPERTAPAYRPGLAMAVPVGILAVLSIAGGWMDPAGFLAPTWTSSAPHPGSTTVWILMGLGALASIGGILLAYGAYLRAPELVAPVQRSLTARRLRDLWLAGWGFDGLYGVLFVRPIYALARFNRHDVVDRGVDALVAGSRALHGLLSRTQTGNLRWYAAGIAAGLVVVLAVGGFG